MIAMALACSPKLVIADEPTTALDVTIQAQIMALLAELQAEVGMAVLLITHDLPLVRTFAERVGVMRAWPDRGAGYHAGIFEAPTHEYTRQLIEARPARMVSNAARSARRASRACVLSTRKLCVHASSAAPAGSSATASMRSRASI